jgi:hypothetical protein
VYLSRNHHHHHHRVVFHYFYRSMSIITLYKNEMCENNGEKTVNKYRYTGITLQIALSKYNTTTINNAIPSDNCCCLSGRRFFKVHTQSIRLLHIHSRLCKIIHKRLSSWYSTRKLLSAVAGPSLTAADDDDDDESKIKFSLRQCVCVCDTVRHLSYLLQFLV